MGGQNILSFSLPAFYLAVALSVLSLLPNGSTNYKYVALAFKPTQPPTALDQHVILPLANTPVKIQLRGSDPNPNAKLTALIIDDPIHGTLGNTDQNRTVNYFPEVNFAGNDSFTFKVNNGKLSSVNTGTVSICIPNQMNMSLPLSNC